MQQIRLAIIGAGVVARALTIALNGVGINIDAIGVRNQNDAGNALRPYNLHSKVTSLEEAAKNANVILIAVSDDAIQPVIERLYQQHVVKENTIVIHFSGAQSSDILRNPFFKTSVASAHPLQTFPNVDAALSKLKNTHWFCEGDADALNWVRAVIEKLKGRFIEIETKHKTLYHIGAVFACNYLTALVNIAQQCHQQAGIDKSNSLTALRPLIEATLENIVALGTTQALTGPIARGDVNIVKNHLESLQDFDQQVLSLYKSLGLATIEISREKGVAGSEALLELETLFKGS